MADRSRAQIRFHLASHKPAKPRPTCFHASAHAPAARASSFPFALTPASETAISRQDQHALRSNSVNNLLHCLQILHFSICKHLISSSAESSVEALRIPQQNHPATQTCIWTDAMDTSKVTGISYSPRAVDPLMIRVLDSAGAAILEGPRG